MSNLLNNGVTFINGMMHVDGIPAVKPRRGKPPISQERKEQFVIEYTKVLRGELRPFQVQEILSLPRSSYYDLVKWFESEARKQSQQIKPTLPQMIPSQLQFFPPVQEEHFPEPEDCQYYNDYHAEEQDTFSAEDYLPSSSTIQPSTMSYEETDLEQFPIALPF